MSKKTDIVSSQGVVALIGGGQIDAGDIDLALQDSTALVAADGGARAALDQGHMPDAVIGDFDSLDGETAARLPADRLFPIREQDSTDFDKALRHIAAPLVLAAGFLGGRVDHQLVVLNTLVRRKTSPCILIGTHEVIFHAPPEIRLGLDLGATVSLFPLAPVMGRSGGLRWPIDGIAFAPGGPVGTSNEVTGPVHLRFDDPGIIVMVPRAAFGQVRQAFLAPDRARWPARAE
ncbi:thiamine diphosphokinase [Ruegeria hyattellae]|uniref:thiamine diphosphokinase n=1 Tax=Ruegeria hyattellae TaxID=3233337 RepID=UPI00355AE89A